MNSFIASCAPNPASGASFSGGAAFALITVCVVPPDGGGGDATVDRKRGVCLEIALEELEEATEVARLITLAPAAWEEEMRCVGSRLRSSLELAEENIAIVFIMMSKVFRKN